jgi:oligopeptidase B
MTQDMEPPVAPARDGADPYAWMRYTGDPAMLAYLAAERAYYDQETAHTVRLRDELAAEMSARLAPADESAGWELGGWYYFTRTLPGLNYEQFCRRPVAGPVASRAEQVLLDENLLAGEGDYVALGVREVSPDGKLLAYSADFDGDEVYQLRLRDLATGTDRPERIERSYYGLAWSADSRSVFYTVTDPIYRPYQVWRHDVGTAAEDDVCVFTEDDERFEVFVRASRSGAVIFIECESRDTTETWTIAATQPRSFPMVVQPRRTGTEYRADHGDGELFLVTNDHATEFRLVKAPVAAPRADGWSEVVPESADTRLVACDVFSRLHRGRGRARRGRLGRPRRDGLSRPVGRRPAPGRGVLDGAAAVAGGGRRGAVRRLRDDDAGPGHPADGGRVGRVGGPAGADPRAGQVGGAAAGYWLARRAAAVPARARGRGSRGPGRALRAPAVRGRGPRLHPGRVRPPVA